MPDHSLDAFLDAIEQLQTSLDRLRNTLIAEQPRKAVRRLDWHQIERNQRARDAQVMRSRRSAERARLIRQARARNEVKS